MPKSTRKNGHEGMVLTLEDKGTKRGRSSIACLTCRMRKVRCDVMSGAPCSNCKLDVIKCVVRRDRRNRKHFASLLPVRVSDIHLQDYDRDSEKSERPWHRILDTGPVVASPNTIIADPVSNPSACQPNGNSSRLLLNADGDFTAARTPPQAHDVANRPQRAICGRIDIEQQEKRSWERLPHFIEPISDTTLSAGHIIFLETQDVFNLPNWSVQTALIEAYAEYAYPYMPLIQVHEFLGGVEDASIGGSKRYSLLLYFALLFAGAAFVDHSRLDMNSTGFCSRKAARRELSRRATLLHDLGFEKNCVVLTQTALLMSSWSDIAQDNKDSWYWMGLAISNAFASGLNTRQVHQSVTQTERKLRKRIWWSCYMRDRFLAMGLHRPARIKDENVSIPGLEISDFELATLCRDNTIIKSHKSVLYRLDKQVELAEICVHRSRLSSLIESILTTQAACDDLERLGGEPETVPSSPSIDDVFAHSAACLELWSASIPTSCEYRPDKDDDVTPSLVLHQSHLQMTFHTLMYTLHRPRALPVRHKKLHASPSLFSNGSGRELLSSAIAVTSIVTDLRNLELDSYLPVSGVTIIFPAMVICLLEMRNEDPVSRQEASIRFATCMKVMESLQETYVAADVAIKYFNAALEKSDLKPPVMPLQESVESPNYLYPDNLSSDGVREDTATSQMRVDLLCKASFDSAVMGTGICDENGHVVTQDELGNVNFEVDALTWSDLTMDCEEWTEPSTVVMAQVEDTSVTADQVPV
ncbi:fungal-specific transcription factor domain-containing protein [Emericellopsis atlantica]|uniref:Fungal-specific transcription factor domain-containing protein n=1 Tax=Emericellopsis atlantica TaxID=2614577 RepID=A0A9P7ZUE1_9HYPO|nr:fungal-specific transcription factor domain-containing protein [Emericellopsis atlantica]KAG9258445.1 fungal-specific transcription factor domain-containing protein [Emericellopsis atlantica]